jgi:hypothetical protein
MFMAFSMSSKLSNSDFISAEESPGREGKSMFATVATQAPRSSAGGDCEAFWECITVWDKQKTERKRRSSRKGMFIN